MTVDVLRLVAVMLVLGRHLPAVPDQAQGAWVWVLETWQRGGWVGVDLFFVISGFLVAGLLLSEFREHGRMSVLRFYVRRGWKIYPPFFVFIAITMVRSLWHGWPVSGRALLAEGLFLQSYLPAMWPHTWSLSVEEHFYLLLPAVLFVLVVRVKDPAGRTRRIFSFAGGLALLLLVLRLLNWEVRYRYTHLTHLFPSYLRLDSLFFGVAIAWAYNFEYATLVRMLRPRRRLLVAGGLLALAPAFVFELERTPFIYTAGLTVFFLGSGMLLLGVLLSAPPVSRTAGALAYLGRHTYSIYLWHLAVLTWVVPKLDRLSHGHLSYVGAAVAYLGGSLAVGVLMSRIVEQPALKLRDRLFPRPV